MGNYWVIGGTSGIGRATHKKLEAMGHKSYQTGMSADVTDPETVNRTMHRAIRAMGSLDGIVYSAGINRLHNVNEMGPTELAIASRVIQVNLMGFINVMATVVSPDPELDPLRVVAVSSDAAERPMRTSAAYCASKAGLNMAVKCFARELGPAGWRINAVAPGMTAPTEMSMYIDETVPRLRGWSVEQAAQYERSQEVVPGRIHPNEVAEVIISTLLGPDHLNGSIITINGGR